LVGELWSTLTDEVPHQRAIAWQPVFVDRRRLPGSRAAAVGGVVRVERPRVPAPPSHDEPDRGHILITCYGLEHFSVNSELVTPIVSLRIQCLWYVQFVPRGELRRSIMKWGAGPRGRLGSPEPPCQEHHT
jgi:hypothetical protein